MKTKSFLFASLLTVSFATTSCQKEENIMPATDHSSMTTQNVEIRKAIIDGDEVIIEKAQNLPTVQIKKDSTVITVKFSTTEK